MCYRGTLQPSRRWAQGLLQHLSQKKTACWSGHVHTKMISDGDCFTNNSPHTNHQNDDIFVWIVFLPMNGPPPIWSYPNWFICYLLSLPIALHDDSIICFNISSKCTRVVRVTSQKIAMLKRIWKHQHWQLKQMIPLWKQDCQYKYACQWGTIKQHSIHNKYKHKLNDTIHNNQTYISSGGGGLIHYTIQ